MMNGNGMNNMRPPPPSQHFPHGQMGAPFSPMDQHPRPLDPHHAPGPFAGPNDQMDTMSHRLKGLNIDSGATGRGRTGFDQVPLHRTPSVDDDEGAITYEGWTLYRAEPSTSQSQPNWSCATRSPMHLSQDELSKLVQKQKKKTIAQQFNELGRLKREQIDRLIEDRKRDDNDPRSDWSVVYINTKTKDVGRRGMTTEYVTLSVDIIIRKEVRPGASLAPRADKAFKRQNQMPDVVDFNRLHEQMREKGKGKQFPDTQFSKSPPPFAPQSGQFPGHNHPPLQLQEGPPPFVQLNHDAGPQSPQHPDFMAHDGGFPGMQQQQQPMRRPPHGVEIMNGPMRNPPPPQHNFPPPPPLPRQEPQIIPPLVREAPLQFQKQKSPKIINTGKKSPMKEKVHVEKWPETDSSVGDEESILFEHDNESSATEDSFFLEEHEKHPLSRGPSQRRPSKGRHQPETTYRGSQRPPIKYPASPDRRHRDPFYDHGPVEIIPEKSIGRRPAQLSRSTSVSYPARPRQVYEDRSDRRRPSSPFRNDMLSPSLRLTQPPFPEEFARDHDWERSQRERERELDEHVRNSRLREKEEDLLRRQQMLDREDDLRRREKSLEYREIRLEQEQAQAKRAILDRADSFERPPSMYPVDRPPRRRADSFERLPPVYPADGPRRRADSFERPSPAYPYERLGPVDRMDRMDRMGRMDHIERGRRPPLDSRRQTDYFFEGPGARPFR